MFSCFVDVELLSKKIDKFIYNDQFLAVFSLLGWQLSGSFPWDAPFYKVRFELKRKINRSRD